MSSNQKHCDCCMNSIPKALKGHKYPDFIKDHQVFRKFPSIDKIFAQIGLANCSEKIVKVSYELNENERFDLTNSLYGISEYFTDEGEPKSGPLDFATDLAEHIDSLDLEAKTIRKSFKTKDGKFSIKSGTSIIDAFEAINAYLPKRDRLIVPKPDKTLIGKQLVFSSDYWDMATISMRGISSCMRWLGQNSDRDQPTELIGSMVDPYAALIYITDNKKTAHGSKMLWRAIVRLVAKSSSGKSKTTIPALLIERIYPDKNESQTALAVFKEFLARKTKNKLPILYPNQEESFYNYNAAIPLSDPVEYLMELESELNPYGDDRGFLSYRDSDISYRKIKLNLKPYITKSSSK